MQLYGVLFGARGEDAEYVGDDEVWVVSGVGTGGDDDNTYGSEGYVYNRL